MPLMPGLNIEGCLKMEGSLFAGITSTVPYWYGTLHHTLQGVVSSPCTSLKENYE